MRDFLSAGRAESATHEESILLVSREQLNREISCISEETRLSSICAGNFDRWDTLFRGAFIRNWISNYDKVLLHRRVWSSPSLSLSLCDYQCNSKQIYLFISCLLKERERCTCVYLWFRATSPCLLRGIYSWGDLEMRERHVREELPGFIFKKKTYFVWKVWYEKYLVRLSVSLTPHRHNEEFLWRICKFKDWFDTQCIE